MDSSLFRYCVPCLFGLEGLVADELRRMDLPEVRAEDGRVFFSGTLADCVKANLSLRCGERVLLQLGSFPAPTFDALFEGVRAIPWGSLLPKDASFPVTGYCLNSALFSVPDCQRIVKKAVVESMKTRWKLEQFPETGAEYKIRFSIRKDLADLFLDTSGTPLHKRGYRPAHTEAALRETLAAAMVKLARYRGKGDFCDPFCGSGTIAIEAALAALNRAPGLYRSFAAENWAFFDPALWRQARADALVAEYTGDYHITASDIDPRAIQIAQENAVRAGVEHIIDFRVADAAAFSQKTERGVIVTNPPYGERLLDVQQAEDLYRRFGAALSRPGNEGWSLYLLSSDADFEHCYGKPADKKRKLYNGMIKCDLYMYYK
ncbi:MAG: class I SAM-dependent RNA methyltransferase [Oscillospiraceae bacterium]|nr:class I SAM-dependent RNA methyltransferase [Oscillospiraceae bacterium]